MNTDSLSFNYAGLARNLSPTRGYVRERRDSDGEQSRRRRKDVRAFQDSGEAKAGLTDDPVSVASDPDPEAAVRALSRRPDLARRIHRPDDRKVAGALNNDDAQTTNAKAS